MMESGIEFISTAPSFLIRAALPQHMLRLEPRFAVDPGLAVPPLLTVVWRGPMRGQVFRMSPTDTSRCVRAALVPARTPQRVRDRHA